MYQADKYFITNETQKNQRTLPTPYSNCELLTPSQKLTQKTKANELILAANRKKYSKAKKGTEPIYIYLTRSNNSSFLRFRPTWLPPRTLWPSLLFFTRSNIRFTESVQPPLKFCLKLYNMICQITAKKIMFFLFFLNLYAPVRCYYNLYKTWTQQGKNSVSKMY